MYCEGIWPDCGGTAKRHARTLWVAAMSGYLIVNEINALTRRLYAEGYTRENHPDTVYWSDFQNLGYKWETMLGFTWETPCGLLIQGESDIGRGLACGDAAYQGVWYCPENNNPLLLCPY